VRRHERRGRSGARTVGICKRSGRQFADDPERPQSDDEATSGWGSSQRVGTPDELELTAR
jgi:hypothetical protein